MNPLHWVVFAVIVAGTAGAGTKEILIHRELARLRPPLRALLPPPPPVPPPQVPGGL